MWSDFQPEKIREELQLIRGAGMAVVRAFCFWPDFMPTKARVEPGMLQKLNDFMVLCEEEQIGVYLTPIVGHMSGENWPPQWLDEPADLYIDEEFLQVQELYVSTIARTVAASKALRGHIISNEMPLFAGVGELQSVTRWAERLYKAVRSQDPERPISIGDGVWSLWGEQTGFRPTHKQDFLGLHMYPSETDAHRHTFLFGLNARMAAMYGKPVLMEEFGAQHSVFGDEEIGGFASSVLYESWANGAFGAFWWCGFDFALTEDLPYSHHPFELKFGMHDVGGRPKPAALAFKNFAALQPTIDSLRQSEAQVAHLVPSFLNTRYPFSWDDLDGMKRGHLQAYTLARLAGVDVTTFKEPANTRQAPETSVLHIPNVKVVYAGALQKLRAPSWKTLESWIEGGGTFVMSFDLGANDVHVGTWHHDFCSQFGVKPKLRFGLTEPSPSSIKFEKAIGDIQVGTVMQLPAASNVWHGTPLLASTEDAEVYAVDDLGRPALWRATRGKGAVWLFSFPVEHAPTWNESQYEQRATLLRAIFQEAGVITLENQLLGVVGKGDATTRLWMNHSWSDKSVNLPAGTWTTSSGEHVTGSYILAAKAFEAFKKA